ncbi:MAG: RNA polymerase sigma-70 factor [Pedobacter sp.]|uniref:RNA polymerase sigma factor n=1 Tax=Pedobacter sp. TaxID=1411316 RepID=UPI002809D01E|nr:RNA polymerase sigma-70 factor [Pedobacter sp.]MDQ8006218.1 RNA polymerase sigma-70 factor [Pedobacter sp.]
MTKKTKSNLLDAELILEIKNGNEQAFYELYTRYSALLLVYAHRKLADKEEAKDVVQEVFVRFWDQRANLEPDLQVSAYLYKAVLNKVLNIYKHKDVLQRFETEQINSVTAVSNDTDFLIREKEIKAMIDREIEAMPPRMREIYQLKKQYFLSTKAIAEKLDLSEHTVSTQLKRAAKLLKDKFGLVIYVLYILR